MGGAAAARVDRARRAAGGGRGATHASGRGGSGSGWRTVRAHWLILGLAGPQGESDETGVAVGRDLVIVIDLSRSMQALDMADPAAIARWQARVPALDLLAGVRARADIASRSSPSRRTRRSSARSRPITTTFAR